MTLTGESGGFLVQVTITVSGAASCAGGNIRNVEIGAAPFVIGRGEGCHLVMTGDGTISGAHCELREHQGGLVLVDRSSNGTCVDQPSNRLVKGQPTQIPDSCTLLVGAARIELRANRPGGDQGLSGSGAFEEELFTGGPAAPGGRRASAPPSRTRRRSPGRTAPRPRSARGRRRRHGPG